MTVFKNSNEEAHEYVEKIIDTVREPMLLLDQNFKVLSANRYFYDIFKVGPEETEGQLIYDIGNKQWDIPELRQLLETTLPLETALDEYEIEQEFTAIGRRTMLFNARKIQRKSGKERLILIAIEDITERKRQENLLSESEERYRRLFETANDGIVLLERSEGSITHANPAITEMLGYRPDELIGKRLLDIGFPGDTGTIQEIFQTLEKNGILHYQDAPVQTKTRQVIDADIYMVDRASLVQCNIRNGNKHKRVKERSQESEEMYRLLVESSKDIVWKFDLSSMRYTYFSKSVETILGYSQEEMIGATLDDIYSPQSKKKVFADYDQVFRGESNSDQVFMEAEHRHKNGTPVWLENNTILHRDNQGQPVSLTGVSRDITERKQAEQALRRSENHYRAIFETSGTAMFIIEEDTTISQINTNFEKLSGYSKQEAEGKKSWTEFIHADDVDRMKQYHYLRRQNPDAAPRQYEFRFITRHGEKRNIFLAVDMIAGTTRSIASGIDITKRKQAEQAVAASEEKYRSILDSIEDGYFEVDIAGNLTFFNDSACRILGYSSNELMGMNNREFMDKNNAEKVFQAFNQVFTTGDSLKTFDWELIRKDGEKCYVDTSVSLMRDTNGEVIGFRGVVRDVTDRKTAEAEREKLQAQLNQAQKMESIGRLAGGVAHDFNNKLTIINGYAEMAIDTLDPSDPLRDTIQEIYTAGTKSADIVRQLLAFARQQNINPTELDLNDTISGMLKMLQRLIGENIDLVWRPGNNLWPVKLDPSQVDQIMANLVVNARDAIVDVGRITIETNNIELTEDYRTLYPFFVPGQYVMLAVSDDGSGMDKKTLANLFEPFFTTKGVDEGTGLGLAMTYGIVKQNNGFINVDSEPGQGTTVKIYLPRHETEESALKPAKETTEQLPRGTETILIIEDEVPVLQMARQILERLGYTVQTAENPSVGLQLSEVYNGTIHLLITDVIMPEMNGRDLASRMAMSRPGLKVLYMSGYTANVIAHKGMIDEGVQFIQKPFSMQELAVKVREAIESE